MMGHDGGKRVLHPAATQTASLFKSSHRASRINREIEASLQASLLGSNVLNKYHLAHCEKDIGRRGFLAEAFENSMVQHS